MEENELTGARTTLGKLILAAGAIPSGCLSLGVFACGLLSLAGGLSATSSFDLAAAFGVLFALILIPASLLLFTLLAFSRVNKRGLALTGALGYLLLAIIGLVWVLLSDLEKRADLALQIGFLSGIFLFTSFSSFVGWWLRGSISKRWVVFSTITSGVVLAGIILTALYAPIQRDASQQILAGHTSPVHDVAWSPDSRYLASASWDGTVNIWDLTTGEIVNQLDHNKQVNYVDWSPDGTRIASASSENVFIWDAETGKLITEITDNSQRVQDPTFSPDSSKLAWLFSGYFIVWDVEAEQPLNAVSDQGPTGASGDAVLWSSDNTLLAYEAGGERLVRWNPDTDETASAWSADELGDFLKIDETASAWSPDERYLAVGAEDGSITIWDLTGEQPHLTLVKHKASINSLSWSPDGTVLASTSADAVILWKMPKGVVRRRFRRYRVWSIAWSPDGTMFATAEQDGSVTVWFFK